MSIRKMKICLVRPPILVPGRAPIVQFVPPIGLAYLAGALREASFEVSVVDALGLALDTRAEAKKIECCTVWISTM